jgi:antirestriction protein
MKLYVGTYAKYNNGSIAGKWLDLNDYADNDEFIEACCELHKDEEDPELMFQDCDYEHDWEKSLYTECGSYEDYYEVRDALDRSNLDEEVFDAYINATSNEVTAEAVEECEEQYCGQYDDPTDFAEEMISECYDMRDIPEIIRYHIDWSGVWRDMSYDGYFYENGYIFDTNR